VGAVKDRAFYSGRGSKQEVRLVKKSLLKIAHGE
jgi:hypothetical protein